MTTNPDVLMLDSVGGAYTRSTMQRRSLGGSEIEMLQVAHGLTAKGHSVVIANGVDKPTVEDGVTYIPLAQAWQHTPKRALYLQRWSVPETRLDIPADVRVVVRANDIYWSGYDVHRDILSSGRASLVTNTKWQASEFVFARDRIVLPPMLEPMPKAIKQPRLFVFASGARKGFDETAAYWVKLKSFHPAEMAGAILAIVSPGWDQFRKLTSQEVDAGIKYVGSPSPDEYRRWIARAEGLFMVSMMAETFCCAAALAERAGTRTHILCRAGMGGLLEAVKDTRYITEDPTAFENDFIGALGKNTPLREVEDLSPSTMIAKWEKILHIDGQEVAAPIAPFPDDSSLDVNQKPLGPFFGDFLSLLRGAITPGGSEFGVGLMLFSLASAIQARSIVEIGRFRGFSTLALAAACHLQDIGWAECKAAEQRPDVDYAALRSRHKPRLISVDPVPLPEAEALLKQAGVESYVEFRNVRSETVTPEQPIDLLFIDGGHSAADVRADIARFVPHVRPGGYFILHDYYGWFGANGVNGSPIAAVIAEDLIGCDRVLIDTNFASMVIFRKTQAMTEAWELDPRPSKMPARADGRPTVGLCIIAKGDEVATVATRAITSAKKAGVDCITMVCDANNSAAEIARSIGADVFIRPSPSIDWERGFGVIARARNEALAIAERRTDYILMLDADDWFEGTIPAVLDHDAYETTIHDGGLQYKRIQLFRSTLSWRYHGIIHEALQMGGAGPMGLLTDLRYMRGHSSYGYQDQDPPAVKYSKHAHLAAKWLHDHPEDTRAQFYLARSYQDAGRRDEAMVAYEKRITMLNGWEEERAYSAYQIGMILIEQDKDPTLTLLRSHEIGSKRAEPLVALCRWYRDEKRRQFSIAYMFAKQAAEIPQPNDGLFVQPWIYQFEAAAEVAICAYWLGQKKEALGRFRELLPRVPSERKQWAEEMIAVCARETAGG